MKRSSFCFVFCANFQAQVLGSYILVNVFKKNMIWMAESKH